MKISSAARALVSLTVVTFALAGCASAGGSDPERSQSADPGDGSRLSAAREFTGDWLLVKGADADGTMNLAGVPITLSIQADATVAGQAPCNTYAGSATVDGAALSFSPLASTRMACVDDGRNSLETRYLAALASITDANRTDDVLSLSGGDVALRYELQAKKTVN